jgi:LPS-assembly protein
MLGPVLQYAFVILLLSGTQQDPPDVLIKSIQFDRNGDVATYTGNVTATYEDMQVDADKLTLDRSTNILTAGEKIHYKRGDEDLEADEVTFNIKTKAGDFKNVHGEVGPGFFIKAEEAHRTEEGLYRLKNATVTTCCDGPRPGWTMAFGQATIDPKNRVTARNSLLRLQNIPVFYLPYVTIPNMDKSRSTGFLVPSTSTSTTKGRAVRESFYWAINRSADAMFTAEYFSKRGMAGSVDFRAIPNRNAFVQVETLMAQDRQGQGGSSARILAFGDLGRGFRGVADMNLVSSLPFRQVYEDGLNVISSPLEHSVAFATRNQPDASLNLLFARNGVFFPLNNGTNDQSTDILEKLPSLELSLPSRPFGNFPLYFSADTSFAGVSRKDTSITTPTVERLDVHPMFEMPIVRSSFLNWSQSFGVRETAYTNSRQSNVVLGDSLNRFALEYSSSLIGPQIERDFGSWRHVIEPSVETRFVGGPDQFQNTIVVDDIDLVTRTNEVEYALTNRFYTTRELFSWRVAQKYFFDPTFGGAIVPGQRNIIAPVLDISGFAWADGVRRFSPIVSTMRVSTSASTSTDVELDYDTRDHRVGSAGIIGNLNRGQFGGGISYFYTQRSAIEIPNNQLRALMSYGNQKKPGLSAAFSVAYDVQHSLFQGSTAQVGYNANCFGLSFEVSQFNLGLRVESRFRFAFTLKDIGSLGTIRPRERLF